MCWNKVLTDDRDYRNFLRNCLGIGTCLGYMCAGFLRWWTCCTQEGKVVFASAYTLLLQLLKHWRPVLSAQHLQDCYNVTST